MQLADECHISEETFHQYADYIFEIAGISLNVTKKSLLMARLQKRLRALGIASLSAYLKLIMEDDNERIRMLNAIVTNTTNFFRENHHFDYLKNSIVPVLLNSRRDSREIRIWSAGCSSGEEPYSIAISVCEALSERLPGSGISDPFRGWDVKILATDISTHVLEKGMAGHYYVEQATGDIPEKLISRYFLKNRGENSCLLTAKEFLKRCIRFRRLNFKDDEYPFSKSFDVIFCRNVMIYFGEEMKRHLITRFYKHLAPGGHLFLGHSETVRLNESFSPVGITMYKRS